MQQGALSPGGEFNSRAQGLPALANIYASFFYSTYVIYAISPITM
jgi:hypothetical protein